MIFSATCGLYKRHEYVTIDVQLYISSSKGSIPANQKAQYDASVKRILASKCILSRILVGTVPEFQNYSYEEAENAIIESPVISGQRMRPDDRNRTEAVQGLNTESNLPGEGEVTFDIVFTVLTRDGEPQKLYINIEAQKSIHLPYDLVSRSIFYPARLLSEQLDREFTTNSYDKIKKVYSIWICMTSPKKSRKKLPANTIVHYQIKPEIVYPTKNIPEVSFGRYDLFSTIFINLVSDRNETDDKLIGMLSALLSRVLGANEKKRILEEQYGIPMTRAIDEEVQSMCNLSEGIVEETTERLEEKYGNILSEKDKAISEKDKAIYEKDKAISEKDQEIARLKQLLKESGK